MTETTAELLDRAIRVAREAHDGQVDKNGRPYVLHPLRVMEAVARYGEYAMIAAVLHDVVEDTPVTLGSLYEAGFPMLVVQAVDRLTKTPGMTSGEYLRWVKEDRIATLVKIADLTDNLAPGRVEAWRASGGLGIDKYLDRRRRDLEILTEYAHSLGWVG